MVAGQLAASAAQGLRCDARFWDGVQTWLARGVGGGEGRADKRVTVAAQRVEATSLGEK